ncbi:retrovirus-related Pol polyprotein from transposon 17.6 [Trichonephila clavipes]|nr:retrovirus-related Pol polyprotein from transposon 17.6 [Trichonephila clavipes]
MHVSVGTSICSYFIKRDFYESIMGHWSGEIIYIGGDIPKIFFYKQVKKSRTQIGKVVKTVEEEKVEIDLSKTKLEEKQKQELQDLFDSFEGLFSDKPGLTHVLYHEIDTGDNPPFVSRLYRYDRAKQEILDYHVDKMLKEGTIIPIQSPYASPVVLCRKKNGLAQDNPEAYRFAVDYRKLNAITKYPRYPLPLIDDLIMNTPHTGIMSALDLRMIKLALKLAEFNIEWEHRSGTQNAVADVLSRNPIESIIGEKVHLCNNQGFGTFVTRSVE